MIFIGVAHAQLWILGVGLANYQISLILTQSPSYSLNLPHFNQPWNTSFPKYVIGNMF